MTHLRQELCLGETGLPLSRIGWGMWRLRGNDVAEARRLAETALETGFTFFDTADVYGPDNGERFGSSEKLFGRVLKDAPALRDRIVLATKGGIEMGVPYNSSADYLVRACEASLERLGVERVDLYQIHRPDVLAHPEEVAGAFDKLRRAGKIREAGVSNYTPAQTAALIAHMPFKLASIQPEFSALALDALEGGILDQAMEHKLAVLAWSPLARGLLTDAAKDARSERVAAALAKVADAHGVSPTIIALAWVMNHASRPVALIGTQTPARIKEAAAALNVTLTRPEWYSILVASRGVPLP